MVSYCGFVRGGVFGGFPSAVLGFFFFSLRSQQNITLAVSQLHDAFWEASIRSLMKPPAFLTG